LTRLVPIASVAASEVEHLLDLAFGTDRHQRTAYKLREGVDAIPELSFAAVDDGALVGSIQCWPVQLSSLDGSVTPLILVGPVAVHPDRQRGGIGHKLMNEVLARADETGREPMMLIGDAIYYDRFFGFSARHTQGWSLPGPVDRDRLLARLRPGQTVPSHAVLGPRRTAALVPGND
jgi:predicted N-acetyltransferase YhbS